MFSRAARPINVDELTTYSVEHDGLRRSPNRRTSFVHLYAVPLEGSPEETKLRQLHPMEEFLNVVVGISEPLLHSDPFIEKPRDTIESILVDIGRSLLSRALRNGEEIGDLPELMLATTNWRQHLEWAGNAYRLKGFDDVTKGDRRIARDRILGCLRREDRLFSPEELAEILSLELPSVETCLARLGHEGLVTERGGRWCAMDVTNRRRPEHSQISVEGGDSMQHGGSPSSTKEWDVFISHASEDRASVVEPLAVALRERGLSVWFDQWVLTIGDSLREKIDQGLACSKFGIVVLSRNFFAKDWTRSELNGLVSKEHSSTGKKLILPVWHNLTKEQVARYSPILSDRLAGLTEMGIDQLATELVRAMQA